jgi:hypothetical protein
LADGVNCEAERLAGTFTFVSVFHRPEGGGSQGEMVMRDRRKAVGARRTGKNKGRRAEVELTNRRSAHGGMS